MPFFTVHKKIAVISPFRNVRFLYEFEEVIQNLDELWPLKTKICIVYAGMCSYAQKSHQKEKKENEKQYWHELASILNILVSAFYIFTQVVIIVFYLLPCI